MLKSEIARSYSGSLKYGIWEDVQHLAVTFSLLGTPLFVHVGYVINSAFFVVGNLRDIDSVRR